MKRLGNLYDKIISMDNLRLADERARKGKTHSYGVRVHDKHAEADLLALHEALKAYKAKPLPEGSQVEEKEETSNKRGVQAAHRVMVGMGETQRQRVFY